MVTSTKDEGVLRTCDSIGSRRRNRHASITPDVGQPLGANATNAGAGLRRLAPVPPDLELVSTSRRSTIELGQLTCDFSRTIRSLLAERSGEQTRISLTALVDETASLLDRERPRRTPLGLATRMPQGRTCGSTPSPSCEVGAFARASRQLAGRDPATDRRLPVMQDRLAFVLSLRTTLRMAGIPAAQHRSGFQGSTQGIPIAPLRSPWRAFQW
jgi:hypothetical protein